MDPALVGVSIAAIPVLTALAAVAGIGRAGKRRRARAAMKALDIPATRRDIALIMAMGGDPLKHRINPVDGQWQGLRLVDAQGNPVRFMTLKQLRTPKMRERFKAAERQVQLQAEAP